MKAVLDACVVFPTVLREILIEVAGAGLYQPVWSPRILEEWRRAADREGLSAGVEIALMTDRFPQAMVADDAGGGNGGGNGGGGGARGLDLPDPADRHVIETALAARADAIITANLRDFPRAALAAVGLRAVHPDEFLRDLYLAAPHAVGGAVAAIHARARAAGGDIARKELMRRARLPRLAKAMERVEP